MDRALQPGMRLMRRISIAGKFGVVTLLLLLPLTIGVGSGYAESTGLLRSAKQEQAGLRLATPLVQLVVQVAQAQDAAARGIASPQRLTAVDAVEAAMSAVPADVAALRRLAPAWQRTRARVDGLTSQARPGAAAVQARAAMDGCLSLLRQVSDASGLTDDPELGTHYLVSGLIWTLPNLLQAAGAAASNQAAGVTAQDRRLEQAVAVRSLRGLADRLGEQLVTSGTHAGGDADAGRAEVGAVRTAVAQYAAAAGDESVTPLGSGSLAAGSAALAAQLSATVDGLLTQRQQELAGSRDRPVLLALGSLLVLGYLLVAVYRATSQDVHAVLEDISTVTNGEQPREDLPSGSDEFARMSRAVTITRDRLTALLGSLRYQATHDELTALGNRTLFTDKIADALAATGPGVAVVVVDLDHFRDVNDSFGHDMGDRMLRAVGVRFHRAVGRQNVVARLGSDEFGVLLPRGGGEDAARDVVGRLHEALRAPIDVDGRLLQVRASFGVAVSGFPDAPDRRGPAELIRDADVALAAARDTAPRTWADGSAAARVSVFEPAMHERTRARTELSAELVDAVERGELQLLYQPIVDLATNAVHGVEALARWNHPTRGLVPPTVFVPLAEATGSIVPIGRWVLREAALQLARWRAEFPDGYPLTMEANLSTGQLADPGLVQTVIGLLEETGIDPQDLTLEITESALVEDLDAALRPLRQLSAIGVRLALDDFGTGYSSLTYLRRLPVQVLKIDRSFVVDVDAPGATAGVLLAGIAQLGTGLGMQIVAEGVETARQAARVRAAGCHLGQGFLWARPMPAEDVTALLRRGPDLTPRPHSSPEPLPAPRTSQRQADPAG
ncbi:MAG TPA: bifunctional diguanylate cyclase/phosphodiesterase [Kineosporiaceae bacterium]|nr:bifunctional diguanylate cyclase/phosphodiesterase [Kineosporiaceae bacterium]